MKSALEQEHDVKVCQAIREKDTKDKPQLVALYHHWKQCYVYWDYYQARLVDNSKVTLVYINDFADKLRYIKDHPEKIQENDLGDMEEFFDQDERQHIRSFSVQYKKPADYWLTVLKSPDIMQKMLQPVDLEILKSMTNLKLVQSDDPCRIRVRFEFDSNEYFENDYLEIWVDYDSSEAATEVNATTIDWKHGKDPTFTMTKLTKKVRGKVKKGKKTKEVDTKKPLKTFFRIFRHQEDSDSDEDDSDEPDSQQDGGSESIKDLYSFWTTVTVVELMWESISKYQTAVYYGADLKEQFDLYQIYDDDSDDSGWDSEDDDSEDGDSEEENQESDEEEEPKKKTTKKAGKAKGGKTETKGNEPPQSEECKKH